MMTIATITLQKIKLKNDFEILIFILILQPHSLEQLKFRQGSPRFTHCFVIFKTNTGYTDFSPRGHSEMR